MNRPTRWSYSSLTTYESCPARWKYGYIDNLPSQPSAAMVRGSRLHSVCEDYLNHKTPALPWELQKASLQIDDLKRKGAIAEAVWTLDKHWLPSDPPWVKAIVDVHYVVNDILHVLDFKSGREYPEHRDQLELYALVGLYKYPLVKRAEYSALYLDTGHVSNDGALLRGDMMDHKTVQWTDRAKKLMEDDEFKPTPGGGCRWCDYHAKKGGPCKEGV